MFVSSIKHDVCTMLKELLYKNVISICNENFKQNNKCHAFYTWASGSHIEATLSHAFTLIN